MVATLFPSRGQPGPESPVSDLLNSLVRKGVSSQFLETLNICFKWHCLPCAQLCFLQHHPHLHSFIMRTREPRDPVLNLRNPSSGFMLLLCLYESDKEHLFINFARKKLLQLQHTCLHPHPSTKLLLITVTTPIWLQKTSASSLGRPSWKGQV